MSIHSTVSAGQHQCLLTPYSVESTRRKLRFFFMNPIEKWQASRRVPWKLVVQIVKIFFVTMQLLLFGTARYSHINFYEDSKVTLNHLFLKDWDPELDVDAYPPNQGPYAVYTRQGFYEHVNHMVDTYSKIRQVAIGSYDYIHHDVSAAPLSICKMYYKKAEIWGFNESFIFDSNPVRQCLEVIPNVPLDAKAPPTFDSETYFNEHNFSMKFDRLITVEVTFSLKYILLKALEAMDSPDCYQFDVKILFDNTNHDGQMLVKLRMDETNLRCQGDLNRPAKNHVERALLSCLNIAVILICTLSFILCSRAIIRAMMLKQEAVEFFRNHFGKELSVNDRLEFLSFWYVLIIVNDVLIVIGSIIKIQIEHKVTDGDLYNICSVLLGTGNLLVWLGVLRYLGFFAKYNILILTMRNAVPDVLRFLLCAILLYAGFIFCGWLVLGPYHIKFRSLSSTAECLFSLINGDDMYATFTILASQSGLVWWYSRIYMYTFISLFIYVVLSLFIAVIMDTYETIKMYYQHGFPKSDLMEFISECRDDIGSGIFRQERDNTFKWLYACFNRCCKRTERNEETRPLLAQQTC